MAGRIDDIKAGGQRVLEEQFAQIDASEVPDAVKETLKFQAQIQMDSVLFKTESALIASREDGYKAAENNIKP
jgi:hypothetical protein